jgi:bifunctional non-homologous end joining protein LigD
MKRLEPMLASVGTDVPQGEDWVFEPKYDGIRILAFVDKGAVALVSRNGLNKTHSFPEIADALSGLHKRAKRPLVIDGEIVAMRGRTPARFQALQSRMHVSDAAAIAAHRDDAPAAFVAFDLLLDGKKSLVAEPWRVRRKHLAALLQPPGHTGALRLSDVSTHGERMLRDARKRGWEGVIAKRAEAPYLPGRRTRDWRKLKIERRQEFVVGGWTEPRKTREHIGALLLGYHGADGELIYAGHTGTGFTRAGLADMSRRLAKLARKGSPFSPTPRTNETAHWVRPSVIGVRDDKDPKDVIHEPESMARTAKRKARR